MRSRLIVATTVGVWVIAGQAWSNSRTVDPLGVAVSPQTLILSQDQGGAVTVHTAIPFSEVNVASLDLSGITADAAWADSCGNLVARFNEGAVEAIVAPPSAVLTLHGQMKDGEYFAGSDVVRVTK